MSIVQTYRNKKQSLFNESKDADHMEDSYQYYLLPFADDIIEEYGIENDNYFYIDFDKLPLHIIIEFTEVYYKTRHTVSYEILKEFLQDRANELFSAKKAELGFVTRHHSDNGEIYYVERS